MGGVELKFVKFILIPNKRTQKLEAPYLQVGPGYQGDFQEVMAKRCPLQWPAHSASEIVS